ncbi:MAG TPA: HIT domain-containing protein [Lactovum miscens]|uniref:HIT family protein n=1 Tax=Lactovum miscens TaxID=190387 RepID=UPI002ED8FD78
MCQFCKVEKNHLIFSTSLVNVFHFPNAVSKFHFVVAPCRHIFKIIDLDDREIKELFQVGRDFARKVSIQNQEIVKYSLVELVDEGDHLHIHFIPRLLDEKSPMINFVFKPDGWAGHIIKDAWKFENVQSLRELNMNEQEQPSEKY